MKTLANISKNYNTDNLGVITNDQLQQNVDALIPETIMYVAGYIDAIYRELGGNLAGANAEQRIMLATLETNIYKLAQLINGSGTGSGAMCTLPPPDPESPASDHPDDRFDVSDEFYWEKEFKLTEPELADLYLRTAVKKGKIGVWYKKRFMDIFIEGRTKYVNAPQTTKDSIEAEFQSFGKRLKERSNQAESDWIGAPDIALFANGFYKPSISLMLKIGEPVSFEQVGFNPGIVKDHPVLLIPTGGFYGVETSSIVKASLEEYVKNGGTLVVFTQQHGTDWSLLPTPADPVTGEKKPVTGYGYQEDQSCQFNSVYVDTYHPILSVFTTATANIGVDGYFTSYPDSSMVLLRRVANGQPAMIMYPYGNGYVIATTLYTDFALSHSQSNPTEISLAQNIISWAKKPGAISEIRPGETVNLNINLANFTDTNATAVRFTILDPSRNIVGEQAQSLATVGGQSAVAPFSLTTSPTALPGIYHVDYTLLDNAGNIIQPRAETDSGRFAVSNPPSNPYKSPDFNFTMQSDSEQYAYGSSAVFTVNMWNNTNNARSITVNYSGIHIDVSGSPKTVNIPANSSVSFQIVAAKITYQGWLLAAFNDETGKTIGYSQKGIWMYSPSVNVTTLPDKTLYTRGETVNLGISLKNNQKASYTTSLKIKVLDQSNVSIYNNTLDVNLPAGGSSNQSLSFPLPLTALPGFYTVLTEAFDASGIKIGGNSILFELPKMMLSIVPTVPSVLNSTNDVLSFRIDNGGIIPVSSASLTVSLKDPAGMEVWGTNQVLSNIQPGEFRIIDTTFSIPNPVYGEYKLEYILNSDNEARVGGKIISNTVLLKPTLDKPSYKVRENANLVVDFTNIGSFNLSNATVTVSVPDEVLSISV